MMVNYKIEYGKEPLFDAIMKRDAERALGKLPKNTRAVYVVLVLQQTGERQWTELKGYRKYAIRKEQMDIFIREFKKEFPYAEVEQAGFGV